MKKRCRIWHLPVCSFYSKPFYRDVAARWEGTNLGYLCLLLVICLVPVARNASKQTIKAIDRHKDVYLMQLPPMPLTDGMLTVNAPQPYSIIQGNRTLLLIDTTGCVQTPEEVDSPGLLTQTQLHIRQPKQPTAVYDLKDFNNLTLNQQIADDMIMRMKRLVAPTCYIAIYLFSLLLFMIVALLLGGMAHLIAIRQKKTLDYKAGVRIAVVALTPALIVGGLCAAFELAVPPLLYILPALAYLYVAAGCARPIRPNELYLEDERIGG